MKYSLIILLIINIISFTLMGIDKTKAKKDKYRISEKTLLLSSLLFGSIGFLIGMKVFHHKTQKFYFKFIGLLSLIIQLIIIIYFREAL